jgi:hypothetical protein
MALQEELRKAEEYNGNLPRTPNQMYEGVVQSIKAAAARTIALQKGNKETVVPTKD